MRRKLSVLAIAFALMLVTIAPGPPDEIDLSDPPPSPVLIYQGDDGVVRVVAGEEAEGQIVVTTEEPNGDISIEPAPGYTALSWACAVYAFRPSKVGTSIRGAGAISCWGDGVEETKLRVALQKHSWGPVWNTLDSLQTQWLPTSFIYRSISDSCLTGTYTYRIVSHGYARHAGGTSNSGAVSSHFRTTCP